MAANYVISPWPGGTVRVTDSSHRFFGHVPGFPEAYGCKCNGGQEKRPELFRDNTQYVVLGTRNPTAFTPVGGI